jgi:hypothetical protein
MVTTHIKERFPEPLVQALVIDGLEFDPLPRGQFYPDNKDGEKAVGDKSVDYWAKMP